MSIEDELGENSVMHTVPEMGAILIMNRDEKFKIGKPIL